MNLRNAISYTAFLIGVWRLTACSLLNLGDVAPLDCSLDASVAKCQKLNEDEGISDTECYRYQCRKNGYGCELTYRDYDHDTFADRTCEKEVAEGKVKGPLDIDDLDPNTFPDADEICDGIDNNDNGAIDEGMLPEAGVATEVIRIQGLLNDQKSEGGLIYPISLSVPVSQPSNFFAIVQKDPNNEYEANARAWLIDVPKTPKAPLSYQYEDDVSSVSYPGCLAENTCDFRQVAIAIINDRLLVAGTNGVHAPEGLLLIGLYNPAESSKSVIDLGKYHSKLGTQSEQGVHNAALAGVSDEKRDHAFVMWLDDDNACPRGTESSDLSLSDSVPLYGLGVRISQVDTIPNIEYGDNILFGETLNFRAPALAAWHSQEQKGAVAAYINGDNDVEIALIDLSDPIGDPSFILCDVSFSDKPVRRLVFSMPRNDDSKSYPIAIAYQSGGKEDAEMGVALFDFKPTGSPTCADLQRMDYKDFTSVERFVDGPAISSGKVVKRKTGESIDGWEVIWIEKRENKHVLVGFRFGQQDKNIVEYDKSPFVLVKSDHLSSPVAFSNATDDNAVYFGVVDDSSASPIWGNTLCQFSE